jgi:hypothetical protein
MDAIECVSVEEYKKEEVKKKLDKLSLRKTEM